MSDKPADPPPMATTTATSSQSVEPPLSAAAAVRHRLSARQNSSGSSSGKNASRSPQPHLDRRRSSMLSYSSIEDLSNMLTDDIINPSMTRPRVAKENEEVTHWHSTPLAFAILPALGGLLFKNGSAYMTDVLLIVFAAIFMNWSIRLPWDWYYSAQAQRRDIEVEDDEVALEEDNDETAVESASSLGGSPKPSARLSSIPEAEQTAIELQRREDAAAELRRQELLALLATFVFPMLTAYLLHLIRFQLSSPSSTGLVSDYNLTIFLLAAEIRPCRQLLRLLTNHTLHLQRTVTGLNDPFGAAVEEKSALTNLASRLADLETKLSSTHALLPPTAAQSTTLAQKTDVTDLSADLRKRYEPRLEGLERAVRRYEKRTTTLAMLTEQRIASLESRLQDALSLAAAAAQQSQTRGAFAKILDSAALLVVWPVRVGYAVAMAPVRALEELYGKVSVVLFGSSTATGSVKKSNANSGRLRGVGKDERVREKVVVRKVVR